jgi:hypothetical protein
MKIRIWKRGEKPKDGKVRLPIWIPTVYIKTKSDYVNIGPMRITAGEINYGGIQLKKLSPTEFILTFSKPKSQAKQPVRMDDFLDAGIVLYNADEIYIEIPVEKILLAIAIFVGLLFVASKLLK